MPHRRRKAEELRSWKEAHNKSHKQVRAHVEHAFARMNWRVPGTVRTDPKWATAPVRALPVLTNREVSR